MSKSRIPNRTRRGARSLLATSLAALAIATTGAYANDDPFTGLKLRNIGPAYPSGRISDFAFHPEKRNIFYASTASGGIWKTTDDGASWKPVFDRYGSYAVGDIEMDPSNPNTLWAGTGENNNQRSAAYGDGVYKTLDGGKSWTHMGLKNSGHIGRIWVNPQDSDHVRVAALGPLWSDGGDRGLYETKDGGATWERLLDIDQYTGANEFVVDPDNPDVIVASTLQRRRHVWTMIHGGPGSGLHKSTDGGKTWKELKSGLPSAEKGRIGLALAPSEPGMIYAVVQAAEGGGTYRTTDFGETWEKRSTQVSGGPAYYNEIFVDPTHANIVYQVDTFSVKSEDGGKTWDRLSIEHRHVDDHAFWINPEDSNHIYVGGDGGIYESYDRGDTWAHFNNLPIVQFYRIQPDNDFPFYNVCGGTQDNNSLCGPSRTTVQHGITNYDWNIILGGDGYEPQIDPEDPNIIYTQYQYGGLARYDKRTQERVYMTPMPASGETTPKWNWNTPLIISPHSRTRLYYAAERLYRSDDRGDNWRAVSPDLTRQLDRNELEVMGRVWSVDALNKNQSTSFYGSIIGLSESALREGLIYVGSDDGLISVTSDGGENWRTVRSFRGVPDMSLVEDVQASLHDENVAYAVFDNHKRGDYKPYVYKTTDQGRSWRAITGDLPDWGSAHTIVEDHVDPNLLFVGTEFGLFYTQNGGRNWKPLKTGLPTISVRDVEIQRRESDLVVGTFGRGIYVLDDYSPLRTSTDALDDDELTLFDVKDAWLYVEGDLWGRRTKGALGVNFWQEDNPPFGAVFTYYLRDGLKTAEEARQEREKEVQKNGGDTPYPSWDDLRAEDREEAPTLIFTIRDDEGEVVRRITGPVKKGMHRIAWDLRLTPPDPIEIGASGPRAPWEREPFGPLATPGQYTVSVAKREKGALVELAAPKSFSVERMDLSPEAARDPEAVQAFQLQVSDLQSAVAGTSEAVGEIRSRINHVKAALLVEPDATEAQNQRIRTIETQLADTLITLHGDRTISSRYEPTPMSVATRVGTIRYSSGFAQAPVTGVHRDAYEIAATEFEGVLASLKSIDSELGRLEDELNAAGAPWTPGRLPDWSRN